MTEGDVKVGKEYRPLVKAAVKAGWRLTYGKKHPRLTSPNGDTVTISGSPASNRRGVKNARADLRRNGVAC